LTASDNVHIDVAIDTFLVTFTADTNWNGYEDIVFTIDDQNLRLTDSDTVRITVLPVNDAPEIEPISNQVVDEDSSLTITLSATDIEEDSLGFDAYSLNPSINAVINDTLLHIIADENYFGSGIIQVFVSEIGGPSGRENDSTSFTVTFTSVNDSPYLTLNSYTDTIAVDSPYSISLSAEDVDFDTLTFSIVNNPDWISLAGDEIQLLPDTVSMDTFQIIVSDGELSDEEDFIVTVVEPRPVITAISDVPDDQGGWVYVQFNKSYFDTDTLRSTEIYTVELYYGEDWTAAFSLTAYGSETYAAFVSTPFDSSSTSNGLIDFRVIAGMDEGNFASETAIGYSVDNIAPGVPEGLSALASAEGIILNWLPNSEEDFQYYGIYRSTNPDFEPDTMDSYTYATADTSFTDSVVTIDITYYYRISAFDYSGNESGYSAQVGDTYLDVDDALLIPKQFTLHPNHPNPFNPITSLRYDLPEQAQVTLTVYDLMGREVTQLVNTTQEAGYRSVQWNATDMYGKSVSAGVYLYQIRAGEFVQTKKMVLLK
jgi:hypothetical protein